MLEVLDFKNFKCKLVFLIFKLVNNGWFVVKFLKILLIVFFGKSFFFL